VLSVTNSKANKSFAAAITNLTQTYRMGENTVKKPSLFLSFALVIAGMIGPKISYAANPKLAGLAGHWAGTVQVIVESLCYTSDFSALENCSTSGAAVIQFVGTGVEDFVEDAAGNTCGTQTFQSSYFFGYTQQQFTPVVSIFAGKVTNYNQTTGIAEGTATAYTGGSCTGATFNSSGATATSTGTTVGVVSHNGTQSNVIDTTLTDPLGDVGSAVVISAGFKQ
jgi:hypothetical protein